MIYLVLQMALFLVLAALTGVVIGWWSNQIKNRTTPPVATKPVDEVAEEDIFAIKRRLDKCFDDNAQLRRDLKSSHKRMQKLSKSTKGGNTLGTDDVISADHLSDKIAVLMDDLQLRDDTISVLEKELEAARGAS